MTTGHIYLKIEQPATHQTTHTHINQQPTTNSQQPTATQMTEHHDPEPITITNQVPGYYKCGHCALHFKTRARFRAHEATCLSLKQIRARARATFASEDATTSVTVHDLFALVQQLAVRLETAEHEVAALKRQQQQQQQHKHPVHRDNLLEWLTAQLKPSAPFSDWLAAIPPLTREHLALVFQHGFMDGMCAIVASVISSFSPLCAYDEAPGTLFVYERQSRDEGAPEKALATHATGAWRAIAHPEFERFINRMQKLLMNEFVRWQQEHKERWHDPDFAEQYDTNLLKVTGSGKAKSGGCSNRDMLITRMKPKVHAAIKRSANAADADV
jgi:hypothetical protein